MAHEDNAPEQERAAWQPSPGLAVAVPDPVRNPELPPHHERMTDKDPAAMKRAVRIVYSLFYLSAAGSIWAIAAYMIFPIESGSIIAIRENNLFVGLGIALALLAIGVGAIHWSKAVMSNKEYSEHRHQTRGSEPTRAAAVKAFADANEESGFGRRTMIRNSLFVALVASILPGITLFRGLAPQDQDPVTLLNETMWKKGSRLAHDPSGRPVKASEVTLGSAFHIIPEELAELREQDEKAYLNAKAKAIVLLVRMPPDQLTPVPGRENWSYDGIVAYSKVCTHVGCPVGLYEQQTHHLLCPCHQSQFDISDGAKVIFGPAARPLPQLPITVDDEGYIVAQDGFDQPVGPSFWERH